VYAIDFRAAAELGPDMGNQLDFYLDDRRITPNGRDLAPAPYPWWPGNGHRDAGTFATYGTVPVQITTPGRYTFRVVGRGAADRTTVIDEVRVASLDAIFASRLPTGARSAGEESAMDHQTYLATQAAYAQAYGLKVVAYEGGWSLGGDQYVVPLHSWAKYKDARAANVMAAAMDAFTRAGGELYVMGAYDQWHLDDAAHADTYPLVKGIDARLTRLPAAATARTVIRGSAPVTLKSAAGLQALSIYVNAAPGDWVSWVVQVPTAGDYRLTANTGGGPAAISVDGIEAARQTDDKPASGVVRLAAGVHTLRVQSVGGWFLISGVTIDRLDDAAA
jgi:hypothetical protein